jgi:hypothetical protein
VIYPKELISIIVEETLKSIRQAVRKGRLEFSGIDWNFHRHNFFFRGISVLRGP